jgi:hypothetical protein
MQQQPTPPSRQPEDIFKVGGGSLSKEEATAIQLCWAGQANPGQQRLALSVIIDKLSMADHLAYTQGSFDGSAFLAGRAFVGKLIRKVIRATIGAITQ